MDRRAFACFADSTRSRTVLSNSSTISGVKEASPSSGQTQAWTPDTRTEIPSSLYSKVVCRHSFGFLCSRQIGAGLFSILLLPGLTSNDGRILPKRFIWNVGRDEFHVNGVGVLANDVQVNPHLIRQGSLSTYQCPPIIRVLLDDFTIEHSFNNMWDREALFQDVHHCVAFDEVISPPDALSNSLNVKIIFVHENTFRIGSPPKLVSR